MNTPSSVDIPAILRTAVGALQAGQHAQARQLLLDLLKRAPNQGEARRLLVGSYFQSGELGDAVKALHAWLAVQPGNIDALAMLARALSTQGRHAEAARVLRRALDLAPANTAIKAAITQLAAVARTHLTFGRADDALKCLEPMAGSSHADGGVLMLYGHALMTLGRKADAEAAFRRWLEKEPGSRDAVLRLAAVLADGDGPAEAEALVRADVVRHGDGPEAAFVLGRSLLRQARFGEAEVEFRKVVQARPDHQTAHANLMELVWMRSGDVHEAGDAIDRVLRSQPQLVGLRITKARLLLSAHRHQDALEAIDAGLAASGDNPALLQAASTIALDVDGARALAYAKRLVGVVPNDHGARVALGNASLATGQARVALDIAESMCRANPPDGQAVAMKADALRMLGDPDYRLLLDYRHFVRAEFLDVPDGWDDLASYVIDLASDIEAAHSLKAHPIGNSLRHGSQVELKPQEATRRALRAFPQAIDGPIRRYMEAIGPGSDPLRRRNTGNYGISGMWSVRLRANGFHVNHYHPEGWISSACYLHLPAAVDAHHGEGWLKFGEPAFPTSPTLDPEYYIKPEPGLLALFPSYMWHGTVPFSGGETDSRLTIAFDVVASK